jgi:hypothetical protein
VIIDHDRQYEMKSFGSEVDLIKQQIKPTNLPPLVRSFENPRKQNNKKYSMHKGEDDFTLNSPTGRASSTFSSNPTTTTTTTTATSSSMSHNNNSNSSSLNPLKSKQINYLMSEKINNCIITNQRSFQPIRATSLLEQIDGQTVDTFIDSSDVTTTTTPLNHHNNRHNHQRIDEAFNEAADQMSISFRAEAKTKNINKAFLLFNTINSNKTVKSNTKPVKKSSSLALIREEASKSLKKIKKLKKLKT